MIEDKHVILLSFLQRSAASFRLLEHAPCRSSEESSAARASAGVVDAIGAKALVVIREGVTGPSMIVLPGSAKLDNKLVRAKLGRLRFAGREELAAATGGLEPGMVPPFARPIFPGIDTLFVDASLVKFNTIGFNAARLDRSVVMRTDDYLGICALSDIVLLSQ